MTAKKRDMASIVGDHRYSAFQQNTFVFSAQFRSMPQMLVVIILQFEHLEKFLQIGGIGVNL